MLDSKKRDVTATDCNDGPVGSMSEKRTMAKSNSTNDDCPRQRSATEQYLGKLLIILTLVSFIFVGLILNLVQLFLTLTIRLSKNRSWRHWHKQLHAKIVYAIFAQPVFVLYLWPRWQLDIVVEDMKLIDDVKKNIFGIIIANHTYELDWMTCFVLADQLGNMGNYKCFSKDELKWLPIVGWTFWMADLIYVKREWKRDRLRIADKLNQLLDYDQILLGIFAEGTRWTPEKHQDAIDFARSRSVEPYKHHLFPRPRGFNYTLRHYLRAAAASSAGETLMNTGPVRLFNLEIVLPDKPKFRTFLEGGLLRASVYCEEVTLSDEHRREALESKDEDDCPKLTKLLQDIFRRKDELVEEFASNKQKFVPSSARSGHFPIKSPMRPFVYWLAGMSVTYGTFVHLASSLFADSIVFWTFVVVFLTSGMLLLKRIERESLPTALRKRDQTEPMVNGSTKTGHQLAPNGARPKRAQQAALSTLDNATEPHSNNNTAKACGDGGSEAC